MLWTCPAWRTRKFEPVVDSHSAKTDSFGWNCLLCWLQYRCQKGLSGAHSHKSAANICKLRQWRSQQPSCLAYIQNMQFFCLIRAQLEVSTTSPFEWSLYLALVLWMWAAGLPYPKISILKPRIRIKTRREWVVLFWFYYKIIIRQTKASNIANTRSYT